MSLPLISIIIPVYNVEKYLRDCLDSIQAQTYSNFECICVNNGDEDDSISILEEYAKKDNRFIVIDDPKISSVGKARNVGILKAKGDYITFLDSDDFMFTQNLEYLLTFLTTYQVDIVCGSFIPTPEDSHFDKSKTYPEINSFPYRLTSTPFLDFIKKTLPIESMVCNKLYKQEIVKSTLFIEDLHRGEDETFVLETLQKAKKLIVIPVPVFSYRTRGNSLSKQTISLQYLKDYTFIFSDMYQKLFSENLSVLEKEQFKTFFAKKIYKRYISHVLDKASKEDKKELKAYSKKQLKAFIKEGILLPKKLNFFKRIVLFLFMKI